VENPFPRRAAANPTQYNIDAIAKLEHEVQSFSKTTDVSKLASELEDKLPEE
jgi:hypothetical protein